MKKHKEIRSLEERRRESLTPKGKREKHNLATKRWYQKNKKKVARACKKRRKADPEAHNDRMRLWKQTPKGRFMDYRRGAKQTDRPFELTFEQFLTFWQQPCIYGCPIETVGLDRVDSSKGYTLDNLVPMCFGHNSLKSNKTLAEFENLCVLVAKKVNKRKRKVTCV